MDDPDRTPHPGHPHPGHAGYSGTDASCLPPSSPLFSMHALPAYYRVLPIALRPPPDHYHPLRADHSSTPHPSPSPGNQATRPPTHPLTRPPASSSPAGPLTPPPSIPLFLISSSHHPPRCPSPLARHQLLLPLLSRPAPAPALPLYTAQPKHLKYPIDTHPSTQYTYTHKSPSISTRNHASRTTTLTPPLTFTFNTACPTHLTRPPTNIVFALTP